MPILLKHQPWNDGTEPEGDFEVEWNLWQRRFPPFHDLDIGTRVILVSGGGPRVGKLTWEVEVADVVKQRYTDIEHAWRLLRPLAKRRGISRAEFLRQRYTVDASPSGWLLAWSYTPIRYLGEPRSGELRLGMNGWGSVDTLRLRGITGSGDAGQGRINDPLLRRKVELTAMAKVRQWLIGKGNHPDLIRNTSAHSPFDYEVGPPDSPEFRVEVKGTIGPPGPVLVTANEVRSACDGGVRTVLAVVYDIQLTRHGDGPWQAKGGDLWTDESWHPGEGSLRPTEYRYFPTYD
jgi:hypothetical protein